MTAKEKEEVLLDLFGRLSSKDLLYSCRGACARWDRIISGPKMRARLERRAAVLDSFSSGSSSTSFLSAEEKLIDHIAGAYRKWLVELVLREYRQKSLPLVEAYAAFWLDRIFDPKKGEADAKAEEEAEKERAEREVATERADKMYKMLIETKKQLERKVLEDKNDRLAELISKENTVAGEMVEE